MDIEREIGRYIDRVREIDKYGYKEAPELLLSTQE